MENIYYLLFIFLLLSYFFYLRKVAELARKHIQKYCNKENLQFIALARTSSKIRFTRRDGPHFLSQFVFEFSGDGEASYQGTISLRGYKLDNIDLPAYRIN